VGAGLHAGAEDTEGTGFAGSEGVEYCIQGRGGDGGGAHLGDEAAVHDGEGLAGGAAEQLDDGHVGVEAELRVAGEEGDGLDGHHVLVDDGHGGEPAVVGAGGVVGAEDGARGLVHFACREVDEGLADGRDEGFPGEQRSDFFFGDVHVRLRVYEGTEGEAGPVLTNP